MNKKIYTFALAAHGEGISGGDRIFIEFAKNWSKRFPVIIYLWQEGYQMCFRHKLQTSNAKFQVSKMKTWRKFGFVVNYFARIIEGIRLGLTTKLENSKDTIIYSASEFWMDSLPAFILKMRYQKIIWVAAWYQTAPNPVQGFTEGTREKKYRLSSFLYWFIQLPIKPLINKWADFVLVNNDLEKEEFDGLNRLNKVISVLGAVDLPGIKKFIRAHPKANKIYDAVFQGRFHPQKGIVELIDIWKLVVNEKSDAKLALIGDGSLMNEVKRKIDELKLQKNIKLFGYLFDGEKKYRIFAQSKVVLHPAFYDSGGMASAEAMAFGLPAVGFNLTSFKSYYPKGMIKVPINDLQAFAKAILELNSNKNLYLRIGSQAKAAIAQNWSWDKRAEEILNYIK